MATGIAASCIHVIARLTAHIASADTVTGWAIKHPGHFGKFALSVIKIQQEQLELRLADIKMQPQPSGLAAFWEKITGVTLASTETDKENMTARVNEQLDSLRVKQAQLDAAIQAHNMRLMCYPKIHDPALVVEVANMASYPANHKQARDLVLLAIIQAARYPTQKNIDFVLSTQQAMQEVLKSREQQIKTAMYPETGAVSTHQKSSDCQDKAIAFNTKRFRLQLELMDVQNKLNRHTQLFEFVQENLKKIQPSDDIYALLRQRTTPQPPQLIEFYKKFGKGVGAGAFGLAGGLIAGVSIEMLRATLGNINKVIDVVVNPKISREKLAINSLLLELAQEKMRKAGQAVEARFSEFQRIKAEITSNPATDQAIRNMLTGQEVELRVELAYIHDEVDRYCKQCTTMQVGIARLLAERSSSERQTPERLSIQQAVR